MKYLFINDIEYIIRKRKYFIIILLFLPLLFLLINVKTNFSSIELIKYSMGTRLDIKSYSILELMMFLFSITISLFLIVNIYIKDIEYQLDNIFLRIKPSKYYINKSLGFLSLMFILKLIQYILVIILLLIFNKEVEFIEIFNIFICEYLYIILLQYIFLFIYILSLIVLKNKLISIIFFLLVFIFIPKDISKLESYNIYMLILTILINIIITFIFKKYNKKIIESI